MQTTPIEPQPQIVVRPIGIDAIKRIVRQGGGNLIHRIIRFCDQIAIGVPLGVLGQREVQRTVQQAEPQRRRHQNTAPAALLAAKMPQQRKNHDARHRHAEDGPEPRRLIQHAVDRIAVVILVGQDGEYRRRQRDKGRQRERPGQVPLR